MTSFVINSLKYEPLVTTVSEFLEKIRPLVAADLAFQASLRTRWSYAQKCGYIASQAVGSAPSSFIFADVERCLEHAHENEKYEDIQYFQYWLDKGVRYLNIDSNNRTINLEAFEKGEFPIAKGEYRFDEWIGVIGEGCDHYDTLPSVVRKAFDESAITIQLYVDAGRDDLSRIFINVNDGNPLNEPEKRNAFTSDIAKTIRELASKYDSFFFTKDTLWFTENDAIRRGIDDFIAAMMYFYFNEFHRSANKANLWSAYEVNSLEDKHQVKFKGAFDKFMRLLKKNDKLKALPNRNSIFDLWTLYVLEIKEGKTIDDNKMKMLVSDFVKVVSLLVAEKKTHSHPSWKEPKSFATIVGGRQPTNNKMRYELISERLDMNKYFTKLDKKRTVSGLEKLGVAMMSNWKTPEGKNIDPSKLNDGVTYHKGHKIPYIEGGETTLENTVIQEARDNLKLGANRL